MRDNQISDVIFQDLRKTEEKEYGDRIREIVLETKGLRVKVVYGLKGGPRDGVWRDGVWIPFSLHVIQYRPPTSISSHAKIYEGPEIREWQQLYGNYTTFPDDGP